MSASERTAPRHLWQEAEALLHQLFALFGQPEAIAFQHTLTAKAHKLLSQWLRGAEALLRQLLLIEAAALVPLGPPTSARAPKTRTPRKKRLLEFWPDKPEQWRVTFRVLASSCDSSATASRASGGGKKRFFSAWPLAERAEALLRVFNDPLPYARRLARKLFARPERAAPLAKRADFHGVIPEPVSDDSAACAEPAARKFGDTS